MQLNSQLSANDCSDSFLQLSAVKNHSHAGNHLTYICLHVLYAIVEVSEQQTNEMSNDPKPHMKHTTISTDSDSGQLNITKKPVDINYSIFTFRSSSKKSLTLCQ